MAEIEATVLTIDDDHLTCRMIQFLLEGEGFEVLMASDPQEASAHLAKVTPDLVLLDVQLPQANGFDILKRLKGHYRNLPVIMLTAKAEMPDRLAGFEGGADDYVIKPFEPAELLARVRAVLRRFGRQALQQQRDDSVTESGVHLDIHALQLTMPNERTIELTRTETRILQKLMSNANHIISREALTDFAVGQNADTSHNQIDVYIARLRRKMQEDSTLPQYIITVRGSGYKFAGKSTIDGTEADLLWE